MRKVKATVNSKKAAGFKSVGVVAKTYAKLDSLKKITGIPLYVIIDDSVNLYIQKHKINIDNKDSEE